MPHAKEMTMVVRRSRALPACRHVEIGEQLLDIREWLLHLDIELANTYGKTSRQSHAADRAQRAVDELRNILDSVSSNELPEEGWTTTIYYGADRRQREMDMDRVLKVHRADSPSCCGWTGRG